MYAITSTGYRAIAAAGDVRAGETFAETMPQSLLESIAATDVQRNTSAAALDAQADTALANLRTYRDNANPTNVQTVAAVKTLCRVAIVMIRHRLGKLDGTD